MAAMGHWRTFTIVTAANVCFSRKRPVKLMFFIASERPLSGKADIQPGACEIGFANGRFTPASGHSGNIAVNDRLRPIADIGDSSSKLFQ